MLTGRLVYDGALDAVLVDSAALLCRQLCLCVRPNEDVSCSPAHVLPVRVWFVCMERRTVSGRRQYESGATAAVVACDCFAAEADV